MDEFKKMEQVQDLKTELEEMHGMYATYFDNVMKEVTLLRAKVVATQAVLEAYAPQHQAMTEALDSLHAGTSVATTSLKVSKPSFLKSRDVPGAGSSGSAKGKQKA